MTPGEQFDPHQSQHSFAKLPHVPTPEPMSYEKWWEWWIGLCYRRPVLFHQICSPAEVASWLADRERERKAVEEKKKKGAKKPTVRASHVDVVAGKVNVKDAFKRTA